MKKLISIALILALAAPFWISYTVILYQKHSIKKEIKKQIVDGIDRSELVLLKFSKRDIQTKLEWEHSKEFKYADIMYDVIESETKKDSVFYWCWKDSEETELNIKLNTLVEQAADHNKTRNENLKQLSNFVFNLYLSNKNPFDINKEKSTTLQYAYLSNLHLSLQTAPPSPPPKSV